MFERQLNCLMKGTFNDYSNVVSDLDASPQFAAGDGWSGFPSFGIKLLKIFFMLLVFFFFLVALPPFNT